MKKILILLVLLLTLSCFGTYANAQDVAGWDLRVDKPFYFVGETMNITVYGPTDTIYSLYLCNITNWTKLHVQTRGIGPFGIDSFDVNLDYEWVSGGFYTLNLTVDNHLIDFIEIEIQLDAEFLHEQEHDWLKRWSGWAEKILIEFSTAINNLAEDVAQFVRVNMIETTILIIIAGQVLLHVIYPRFHSWAVQKQRSKGYNQARKGIPGGIIQWHDMEIQPLPAINEPNINKIAIKLIDVGLDPATARTVMWDGKGDPGQADLVRDTVAHIRRKRAYRKAGRKVLKAKGEAMLAGEWFSHQAAKIKYKRKQPYICPDCDFVGDINMQECPLCSLAGEVNN